MRNPRDIANELLVIKAQAGDAAAFDALVRYWSPIVHRYCMRLTQDQDAAQDAVQTCWLKAIKSLHRLSDPACFPGWILRIASRVCTDALRRKIGDRRHVKAMTQLQLENTVPAQSNESLDLRSALKNLSAKDRVLVGLFYGQGMNVAQTAALLGLPQGTVKSRLHTVRKILRTHLTGDKNEYT